MGRPQGNMLQNIHLSITWYFARLRVRHWFSLDTMWADHKETCCRTCILVLPGTLPGLGLGSDFHWILCGQTTGKPAAEHAS